MAKRHRKLATYLANPRNILRQPNNFPRRRLMAGERIAGIASYIAIPVPEIYAP